MLAATDANGDDGALPIGSTPAAANSANHPQQQQQQHNHRAPADDLCMGELSLADVLEQQREGEENNNDDDDVDEQQRHRLNATKHFLTLRSVENVAMALLEVDVRYSPALLRRLLPPPPSS